MSKVDLKKVYKSYYTAKAKPELIKLDKASYLSLEGQGDPSSDSFAKNITALYSVAYALKFMYKVRDLDYVVAKLEGQWYFDEDKYNDISLKNANSTIPRAEWYFRLLIQLPQFVTKEDLTYAVENVVFKKKLELAKKVKWFEIPPREVVQMLHLGPFDKEIETLTVMDDFMSTRDFKKIDHHHEIYLSDFRKTAPEKLRTILREPVSDL